MEMLKNQPVHEGGKKQTENEIFENVLKPKIGYARGLGYGLKPSKSTSRGTSTRLLEQQLEEAGRRADASDRQAEEAERQAQACQEVLQAQRRTISKLEESQLELQESFKTFVARFGGRSP